jgi:hypothetical protein
LLYGFVEDTGYRVNLEIENEEDVTDGGSLNHSILWGYVKKREFELFVDD